MRPMVIDASAALSLILGEPTSERVEELVSSRDVALVPWLFWSEIVNVLARRRRWSGSAVLAAVYDLEQLGIRTESPARTYLLGVIDAVECHGLTAYDAEYFVLAEAADADLVTGDAVLATVAGARAVFLGEEHRLAEAAARYDTRSGELESGRPSWPSVVEYLDDLREEVMADVEALRT